MINHSLPFCHSQTSQNIVSTSLPSVAHDTASWCSNYSIKITNLTVRSTVNPTGLLLQQCLDRTDQGTPLQALTPSNLFSSRKLWNQLFGYPQPPGHANTIFFFFFFSLTLYYRSTMSSQIPQNYPTETELSSAAWSTGICGPPTPISLWACISTMKDMALENLEHCFMEIG